MSRTTAKSAVRKTKKSYTLSRESVAFLEAMRKQRRATSVSSVLEELLAALRREQRRRDVEQSIAKYYSSMSKDEASEQAHWGSFALEEFLTQEQI